MSNTIFDVIIIGGGPSGLTAGIYTSRAFLKTLVVAGDPPGGQLTTTTEVENFPGFIHGIQGPELIMNMRSQAERFEVEFKDENVVKVSGSFENQFTVKTENGSEYVGKTVIVATGASARWLNIPSETKLRGKGVSACATCDGFFFKGKKVAVVGAGDSAMEESTYLTKFAEHVYVLVRGESARASKIMLDRAKSNPKITFIYNTQVKEVLGEEFVTGLKLINSQTSEVSELEVTGLFLAIGHTPNTSFLKDTVELDEAGYVKLSDNRTMSSVKGIFVSGDVADKRSRQAITAAGFGCMAAIDVEKFLEAH